VGRQRRLAIKEKLKDTPGNVKSKENVKRDKMPRFLLVYSPIYKVKSRLNTAS